MSKRSGMSSLIGRCMKAPLRALCRARDLYVRGMTSCAGRIECGPPLGYPQFGTLPRSYSIQSSRSSAADEDLSELIRAASLKRARALGLGTTEATAPAAVPRSQSVAVGRIDEDRPCDFGDVNVGSDLLLPRSRSCAPAAQRKARVFV